MCFTRCGVSRQGSEFHLVANRERRYLGVCQSTAKLKQGIDNLRGAVRGCAPMVLP